MVARCLTNGKTVSDIAHGHHVTTMTVYRQLTHLGLARRDAIVRVRGVRVWAEVLMP